MKCELCGRPMYPGWDEPHNYGKGEEQMNQAIITGNLVRDVELSYTPGNNTAVCHFTVAVERPKRNGEDQGADFIKVTVWGKQAENCDRYLHKGSKVGVSGRIQTGSYKNREGATVYTTEIVAERVEFLSGRADDCVSREPEDYSQDPADYQTFNSLDEVGTFVAVDDGVPF